MPDFKRPLSDEYGPFYATYLQHVPLGMDVQSTLVEQSRQLQRIVAGLTPRQAEHRYAPDKWSVKQVLAHLADTERVFTFRALWFARGEQAALPGMDENLWGGSAGADARHASDIGEELAGLRVLSLDLFDSFPDEAWERRGVASEQVLSVRAVPWIIAGHEKHHLIVLRERYGLAG
jgi:hypothetical protein